MDEWMNVDERVLDCGKHYLAPVGSPTSALLQSLYSIIPITFSRWELNPISTLSHKYCDIGLFTFKCFVFVEISRNVIGRKCASRTKVKQFVVNIARNGNNPFLRCVEMEAEGALDEQNKWSWELGFCPRSSRKSIQRIKISHYSMNFMLRIFI